MTSYTKIRDNLLVLICLSLSACGGSSERSQDRSALRPADKPKSEEELAKKYRELVRTLVSPNEKPVTRNTSGGSVHFPAEYDVKAQERIKAARQELYDNFEEALPFLVEALDDNHYSMTIDWADGDAYYNYSVGSVCCNVIESQLEVYRDKINFFGPGDWHRYDYGPITKEWYRDRKGHSLAELQIEAIDWAIKKCKAQPKDKVGEEANEIGELQKLRDEIAKSGKPAKPRKMLRMVTRDR
jgi:hypothetical protein